VRTGWGDDRLWGGAGTDIVDAGKGDDRCRGFETAFKCEDRARTTAGSRPPRQRFPTGVPA
jgi:hypothetical protein